MTLSVTLRRPDDWHVHLRDGAMLAAVAPLTAARFARAIVMPNIVPPVTDTAAAKAYRARILAALPPGSSFTPLMTAYLTDTTDPVDLEAGWRAGVLTAAKLYPAHATTNSAHGVTDLALLAPVFATMARIGMPLLLHGEVTRQGVDIFDREAVFIDDVLDGLVAANPALKIVLEHITTRRAVEYVRSAPATVAATITPHHLVINRSDIFRGGVRPISTACRSRSARKTGSPCARPRVPATRNSSSVPIPRRTRSRPRNAPAVPPASSTPRPRSRFMRRCSTRKAPSTI